MILLQQWPEHEQKSDSRKVKTILLSSPDTRQSQVGEWTSPSKD